MTRHKSRLHEIVHFERDASLISRMALIEEAIPADYADYASDHLRA